MHSDRPASAAETVAVLLRNDLTPIGYVTLEPRLGGVALLEDGVMFAYVDATGTAYLRASAATARQFLALGSTKHPAMPYWSIPHTLAADIAHLRHVAYQAADTAHLAFSFGINDTDVDEAPSRRPLRTLLTTALLAA